MLDEQRAAEGDLAGLMAAYQQGDGAAVEELIRRVAPSLFRFFSFFASTTEAEDLYQDCWLRIHRSRHTYRAPEPVLPWIFAIARHTRLDGYRRKRRLVAKEVLVAEAPEVYRQASDVRATGRQDPFELLNELPCSQREVVLMLKVCGMSLEEVARATSTSVGAIKQKAHRAYANLRRMLGKTN
jgi:RNA polymerase sigma-70 factor (ECF subfamily)